MKMFTHAKYRQNRAVTARPVKVDVEKAASIMLDVSDVKHESLRQKFRLDIIKTLPPASIDWNTVNWVQIWPFQTCRR